MHSRGPELAAGLAADLADRGLTVAPRGRSTLVSWETADPEAEAKRLGEEGFVIRHLPGHAVRAGVGRRVVDRGGAAAPGYFCVITMMPNTTATATATSATAVSTP